MNEKEYIVLLDDNLKPCGSAPKLASHHANTPLHLAFSCYVFNDDGKLLITQRALSKKVWPGVWTNSFCGHPMPDESLEQAIARRAQYELGIDRLLDLSVVLPDYRYKTPSYNGIIENEFCPVYTAKLGSDIVLNKDEVEAMRWVTIDELKSNISASPDKYSYWTKQQIELIDFKSSHLV